MASTSSPSSRLALDEAGPGDSAELLALLESHPMPGPISIVYTRRPDAWRSLQREGERVRVLVARDRDRVVAMGAVALRTLHVDGAPAPVAYLFGLRARGDSLKSWPVLHRGYAAVRDELAALGVRHVLTTIVESNRRVAAMLRRPRSFMPAYRSIGRYDVFALLPGGRRRARAGVRVAETRDAGPIADFLNETGRGQQYFPYVRPADLLAGSGVPPIGSFRWLEGRPGEILAVAALWNQSDYRQYRVHGYGRAITWMRRLAHLAPSLGLPRLPRAGEELRHATLALWAARDQDPTRFRDLLDEILGPGDPFVLAGAHAEHPLHGEFRRRRHVTYRSEAYRVDWGTDPTPLGARPIYLECGTL